MNMEPLTAVLKFVELSLMEEFDNSESAILYQLVENSPLNFLVSSKLIKSPFFIHEFIETFMELIRSNSWFFVNSPEIYLYCPLIKPEKILRKNFKEFLLSILESSVQNIQVISDSSALALGYELTYSEVSQKILMN